jgi:hypothetical protein
VTRKLDKEKIANRSRASRIVRVEWHRRSNLLGNTGRRPPHKRGSIREIAQTIRSPIANEIHTLDIDGTEEGKQSLHN